MSDPASVQSVKTDLDEVTVVMKNNINKVVDRDVKITELHARSDDLVESAQLFQRSSRSLKKQMWWKDKKMMLLLIFVVCVILLIIIVPIAVTASK